MPIKIIDNLLNRFKRNQRIDGQDDKSNLPKLAWNDLKKIANDHRTWINSEYSVGKQGIVSGMDLSKRILKKCGFAGMHFLNCNFRDSQLQQTDLSSTQLINTDFRGANLSYVNFEYANLEYADFRDTMLQDANLENVTGLRGHQLAGADLSGAKLPEYIDIFDGLNVIEEASKNAKRLFHSILLFCIYSWLTIANATDVDLLTNSPASPLPIIGVGIPTSSFFIVAAALLLCIYIYFHLTLQRLWERLSEMPAIFPNGRALDDMAYPWLLLGLARNYMKLLQVSKWHFPRFQKNISIFLAWWLVPITLSYYGMRIGSTQNNYFILTMYLILSASIVLGFRFLICAKKTLGATTPVLDYLGVIAPGLIYGPRVTMSHRYIFFFLVTPLLLYGIVTFLLPEYVLESMGIESKANFYETDISVKPENWAGGDDEQELYRVQGAQLKGRNLKYANCYRAFMVNADLRETDLTYANLENADLRGARLQDSDLSWANLENADLRGSQLRNANLSYGNFNNVRINVDDLDAANIFGAYFRHLYIASDIVKTARNWPLAHYAERRGSENKLSHDERLATFNFSDYSMTHACFWKVNLDSADFDSASLRQSEFIDVSLCGANFNNVKLHACKFIQEEIGCNLAGANFINADIRATDFSFASGMTINQIESAELDKYTTLPDYLIFLIRSDPKAYEKYKYLNQLKE
jgi:uncharacterized protein YjbI with pentapeptide repeats